ncbi:MAG: general secretion pathway protein GspD [Pirellulaceae bacterium]|nr:general secretion pathway protein GspD [Pirellulaceae bacterium]
MRATVTIIALGLAAGAWGTAPLAKASPHTTTLGWTTSLQVVAQFNSANADKRREADRLLKQAAQAIAESKFELAEQLISQAEQTGAKYDAIFARFIDTPEKLRAELAEKKAAAQNVPGPPGNLYDGSPPAAGGAAGRAIAPASFDAPLGESGTGTAGGGSFAGPAFEPTGQPDAGPAPGTFNAGRAAPEAMTAQGHGLLGVARQALAAGNYPQAMNLVAQARQLGAVYPLNADSPDKVEAHIREARNFAAGPLPGVDQTDFQRQYAQHLMQQAEYLLLYHDDPVPAERLARQAKALPVQYGQFERTPDQLLARIEQQIRAQAAAGSQRPLTPLDEGGERPMRLPAAGAADPRKTEATQLLATAAAALDRGDLVTAQQLMLQVESLQVPAEAFAPGELRPWDVSAQLNRELKRRGGVAPAVALDGFGQGNVRQSLFEPETGMQPGGRDPNVRLTQGQNLADGQPLPNPPPTSPGEQLYQQGLQALENQDRDAALQLFSDAWKFERELDPATRARLKDKLTLLRAAGQAPANNPEAPSPLESVDAQQQLLRQKLFREITTEQEAADRMVANNDPRGALARLNRTRERVAEAELDPASRKQLLTMVDRTIGSLEQYIQRNLGQIELDERNAQIKEGISLDRQRTLEMQNKLAELVERFNQLLDEQRYPEAEVLAKQARELDPDNPVVQNLTWKSRFVRRFAEQQSIREESEQGFYGAITSAEQSAVPFDDREPFVIGDAKRWQDLTKRRRSWLESQRSRLSPAEVEIQKSLKNPVEVRFSERPLAEVLETLSQVSGVPIYLDPRGMGAEGVTTDTPVSIRLTQEISLQSALNLILEPLRLSYVIQNEVLRITSEQTRDSAVFPKVYNVADLVIPIPNFVPSYNVGLPGAIREAHNAVRQGMMPGNAGLAPMMLASGDLQAPATASASVLAQMGATGMLGSAGGRPSQPIGPAGLGGGVQADFDSLIELITSTIAPQSWDDVGGPGAIQGFETNLSLVISQTQEIHEQIADLLEQLRRLQDLQVTIEVRFITLTDRFFERIGIDFDFDIDDNVGFAAATLQDIDDAGPSLAFGLDPTGAPTADLDLSFMQDSFASTVPQFGGFDPATAANFGFAILSDIEVFFLLQAAQGDDRSNILQAPKVTLFNGQSATVSDTVQRPFVTSVIPVVGDFAAAHQPVIVVLSEGTSLSVQAVVSADRRFVRLTLVPFFSHIGDVQEFTFNGRTSSDTGSDVEFDTENDNAESRRATNNRRVTEGTTVQLPTFAFTTVTTTVSVPDGGTVLLGGIKRLREGRNERGVPLLSKVPYVNRLFKNVGIGRETQSLMMMVTPRIIIQEEEEEKLGIDIEP